MNCSICKNKIMARDPLEIYLDRVQVPVEYEDKWGKTRVAHYECLYPFTDEEKSEKPFKYKKNAI